MAKMKNTKIQNADQDAEQTELSYVDGGDAKWYSNFGNQFGTFLNS